jgi:hypothetical protein
MSKTALVVGISNYEPPTSDLTAAVPEARNWRDLLRDSYGFDERREIVMLTESAATRDAVGRELQRQLAQAVSGDLVVFVYCGHGTVRQVGRQAGEEAMLLYHAVDGDREDACLGVSDVRAIFADAPVQAGVLVTMILDCCHAGGFPLLERVGALSPLAKADFSAARVQILYQELSDADRSAEESLWTMDRFSVLAERLDHRIPPPVVVAACEAGRTAIQLPSGDHFLFSSVAIPELRTTPTESYDDFYQHIRILSRTYQQTPQLTGDATRFGHPFLH